MKQNKQPSRPTAKRVKTLTRVLNGKRSKLGIVKRQRRHLLHSGMSNAENAFDHDLIQTSPFGHLILKDGKILGVNMTFAKMVGYRSTASLAKKRFSTFLSEQSQKAYQVMMRRIGRGERPWMRFDLELVKKDGGIVDADVHIVPSHGLSDSVITVHCNDITERKTLQNRLVDSESLFRNVVNSMGDALIITDLQGKVLDVNREFERLTGFDRTEAMGKEIPYPWGGELLLKEYLSWLDRLRKDGALRDFDITWTTKDGRKIAVSLNTSLLKSTSGNIAAMANIARDISERRAVQMELKNQVQRLEVLYDLGRSLTGTLDTEHIARITYEQIRKVVPLDAFSLDLYDENRKHLRPIIWFDRTENGVVEYKTPTTPMALDERPACAKVVRERRSFLELRTDDEFSRSTDKTFGNTQRRSKSLMFVPLFSKDRIIGIISTQSYEYDMYTEEHLTLLESIASVSAIAFEKAKLYQEIVTKSLEIEARNKELDDFTYVVSHDLKEPLISVEGYSKILKSAYIDTLAGEGRDYLQSIIDSCGQMKKLIEDLLQLSRVSKMDEHRHPIDVDQLIRQILDELEFTIIERKAEIRTVSSLPKVIGVEPHLKVVFRNLISNAIKFCDKSRPLIEIGAEVVENRAKFSVKDNGIGIEEKYFDKIFMIFQRLHQREQFEGTGAGLTMVKKIVEAHGGQIWVESDPGRGATFYFTLPLA